MLQADSLALMDLRLARLDEATRTDLLAQMSSTLTKRINDDVLLRMSDRQVQQFDAMNQGDRESATKWLQDNFPNYQDLARDHLVLIKSEVRNGGEILDPVDEAGNRVEPVKVPIIEDDKFEFAPGDGKPPRVESAADLEPVKADTRIKKSEEKQDIPLADDTGQPEPGETVMPDNS